jgi:lipid A 3-O-deacylase
MGVQISISGPTTQPLEPISNRGSHIEKPGHAGDKHQRRDERALERPADQDRRRHVEKHAERHAVCCCPAMDATASRRWTSTLLVCLVPWLALAMPAHAQSWLPDGAFVQFGHAVNDTRTLNAGATWQWQRRWPLLGGVLGGYWDVALGHWRSPSSSGSQQAIVTQLSVTPAWRWRPGGGSSAWFAEAAIGFTAISPIYQNGDRHFSTAFNFADHIAIGRNLDARGHHELALRYEHFSNGGIRRPNPGENFWQLRYAARWG